MRSHSGFSFISILISVGFILNAGIVLADPQTTDIQGVAGIDGFITQSLENASVMTVNTTGNNKYLGRNWCNICIGFGPRYLMEHRVYDRFNTNTIPAGATVHSMVYRIVWNAKIVYPGAVSDEEWALSWGVDRFGVALDQSDWGSPATGSRTFDADLHSYFPTWIGIAIPATDYVRTDRFDVELADISTYAIDDQAWYWDARTIEEATPGPELRVTYTLPSARGRVFVRSLSSDGAPDRLEETTWGALKSRYTQ